ncbi:hypothetical protein DRP43_01750 [candidate division TA06 bacterium]|uniref:Uncharacterized protein n=1 Tax=candidate division TA06 bacterium TaxID=2250710 RepID=A0A660SMN6_UNCT6|nr:MAG: hypothetical protein DRP43_01750 [candidate division TA06 bacterium]
MERILLNIPGLIAIDHKSNSFFLAVESVLKYKNIDYDYDFLMGISLHSFRTNFFPDISISSIDPFSGFNTGEYLFHILGIKWETLMSAEDGKTASNTVLKIIDSINSGIPAIAIHLDGTTNWGLITGYADKYRYFYGRFFKNGSGGAKHLTSWPFIVTIINQFSLKFIDKETLVKNSFKKYCYILKSGTVNGYFNGTKGFEYILKHELYKSRNNTLKNILINLVNSRKSAFNFLKKYRDTLSKTINVDCLLDLYNKESVITIDDNLKDICEELLHLEKNILDYSV